MLRSQLMVSILVCATCFLSGCPNDDPIDPPAAPDAGFIPAQTDAGGSALDDAGETTQNDAGLGSTDSGFITRRVVPTRAITGGGGSGQNEDYKVRLIIGGPTAAGRGANELNTVKVGAGAAQNSP